MRNSLVPKHKEYLELVCNYCLHKEYLEYGMEWLLR